MTGATRVQRKRPRPSQLELIFTHTAGMLLCMVWALVLGLKEDTDGKVQFTKTKKKNNLYSDVFFVVVVFMWHVDENKECGGRTSTTQLQLMFRPLKLSSENG